MTEGEHPAFDTLARELAAEGVDRGTPPSPGDHRMEVLTTIREGRTTGPQRTGEHVRTLAALGFDIGTVSDALDLTPEEVEGVAEDECERLYEALSDTGVSEE